MTTVGAPAFGRRSQASLSRVSQWVERHEHKGYDPGVDLNAFLRPLGVGHPLAARLLLDPAIAARADSRGRLPELRALVPVVDPQCELARRRDAGAHVEAHARGRVARGGTQRRALQLPLAARRRLLVVR